MVWYRRTLVWLIVLLLAANLLGCNMSRKPLSNQVYSLIVETAGHIQSEDWTAAQASFSKLQSTWNKTKLQYQLNQNLEIVDDFEFSLVRLQAFIQNRDKSQAQAEVNLIMDNWKQLNNI